MKRTIPRKVRPSLWLLFSILSAVGMSYYVFGIWSTKELSSFSDLYAQWWAAHELFLHGRNPYTPEIAHQIQTAIYGAPLTSNCDDPGGIAGGFAYPLHVLFLMWPTIKLSFPILQKVFCVTSLGLTFASILLWISALKWKLPLLSRVAICLFAISSFPSLQAAKLQNLSSLVAFLISGTLILLMMDRLILAGMMLAVATIKPQFLILLIPWLAIWTIGNWRERQRLFWSFSATMAAMLVATELVIPGWMINFVQVVRAYRKYTYGHSLLEVWFERKLGMFAGVLLVLLVLQRFWEGRSCNARSPRFVLTSNVALAATLVVIPTLEPHAQLLLVPAFLWILRCSGFIWALNKRGRLLLVATWSLLGWEWLAGIGMIFSRFWVHREVLLRFWLLPLYPSPLIPFGVLAVCSFLLLRKSRMLSLAAAFPTY